VSHWSTPAIGMIYQIHGLAYFVLGVVAFMLPKKNKTFLFAPHLSLLAAYGMLRGIVAFFEVLKGHDFPEWLAWLDSLLLLASYVWLLEFARRAWSDVSSTARLPVLWLYGTTGLGIAMLSQWTFNPLTGLEVGSRWLVGTPAAILTGIALLAIPHPNTTRRNSVWLRVVALAFICYGLTTLVMSESDPRLPTWLPTQTNFLALFGLPVHLIRALCAVMITFGFVSLVRLAGENSQVDAVVFESNEAIAITDANTVILRVNKTFTQSTGYTAEEAIGRKINILKSGRHDQAFYAAMWDSINRTGTWQGEIWDRRKNGEIYPIWITITAVTDFGGEVIHYVSSHVDIGELKRTQQILQDKERMLSDSQRIAHIGSWSMDMGTERISWSDEMYRVFAVTPESFGHSIPAFLDRIHPDDRVAMQMWVGDCMTGKAPKELDFRIMLPDGVVRYIRGSGELQYGESQKPLRMVGSAQDITEHKLMEDELKNSEAKFRSIIEVSPVPMLLNDEQLNVIFLNPAFVRTFGYTPDDIPTLADWWLRAYPDPDCRHRVEATWQTVLEKAKKEQTDFPPLELTIRCKNNSNKTVLANAAIRQDFADEHLVILYDISQRKQFENKLNAIFNAALEGIITFDSSGLIVSANAAVETIFGYKPEQLVGFAINKLIPSSDCYLADAGKYASQIREIEGLHKNGSVIPLDLSIAEFTIDDTRYFTKIVRDVSLRKYREQQAKQHLHELAHVTRLGLISEMASGLAHEVNQPLAAISSYAQVSLNLIKTENPDLATLGEVLNKTQQQVLRAGRIIHRMREFGKLQTKQRSSTDVNALIHGAVDLCEYELKQNNISLTFALENNLPPVRVDQVQIEQVIINLIRNSVDALKNLPEKQRRHLTIQSHLIPDDAIRVRVKDNGPGLDQDQQQKILMPFYTTKAEGMGMGLSISRSLVEAHKGKFHFNSISGKGTTFYFTLPIEEA